MNNKRFLFFLLLIFSTQILAQESVATFFNIGVVQPIGKLSDFHGIGYEIGAKILIPTNFINKVSLGIFYSNYPGKEFNKESTYSYSIPESQSMNSTQTESYESAYILKLFLGPQINIQSFYLLPNISGNISGGSFRIGFDFNIGYYFQIGKKYFIDIYGRYDFPNIIGKNEGESTLSALHAGIGFGF